MKVAVFSTKSYDKEHFNQANGQYGFDLEFFDVRLEAKTARLAHGFPVVCLFVNDDADREVLTELAANGTQVIALRCAGYNNVDLAAAKELGLKVVRVPAYSPEATAEHAVGMMMCLNRRIHKAYQRTRDANFSLEGLVGFNMHGKTVGVIGTGKIGLAALRILKGFGVRLLVNDPYQNPAAIELGAEYVDLDTLFRQSDIISLHCPAVQRELPPVEQGGICQDEGRGDDHQHQSWRPARLQRRHRGTQDLPYRALGLDVYEEEEDLFFSDKSNEVITDDVFRRLSACHNVLFTGHQAFLTREALHAIADTTLGNIRAIESQGRCDNEVE